VRLRAAHRGRKLHRTHAAVAVTRAIEAQVASIAHQQQLLLLTVRQGGDRKLAVVQEGRYMRQHGAGGQLQGRPPGWLRTQLLPPGDARVAPETAKSGMRRGVNW